MSQQEIEQLKQNVVRRVRNLGHKRVFNDLYDLGLSPMSIVLLMNGNYKMSAKKLAPTLEKASVIWGCL